MREVWLWEFGGLADQPLNMDHTQVAVLVFDLENYNALETLGLWDRDLSPADNDNTDHRNERTGAVTKPQVACR